MLRVMRVSAYFTLAALALTAPCAVAQQTGPSPGASTFNVFLGSNSIGFEQVEVSRDDNGWTIRSQGDLSLPVDLQNQLFQVEYDEQWRPRVLRIVAIRANTPYSWSTTFSDSGSTSELQQGEERVQFTEKTPPDSIVLPEYFFGGYEALAARLATAGIGDEIPIFVPPQGVTVARLEQILPQQMETASTIIDARMHRVSLLNAAGPLAAEIWTDARHRLLRVSIPRVGLDVAREDIVLAASRVRTVTHAGDEDTRIQSRGFSLAATVTAPVHRPRPETGWPAVLLVPGTDSTDRDGTLAGVPVLGQVANALADAGYLTLRYDRRGTGQSGGRGESATFDSHTDDARALVRYLDRRDDVNKELITLVGYADGGWLAMEVARRENRADRLVLVGTPSGTGADWVLEQQRTMLDRLGVADTERAEKIALQQRVHEAVLGEGPWTGVPETTRQRAATPWFRSLLEFDANDTLRRTRQPLLIARGARDDHVGSHHAQRLTQIARERRRNTTMEAVTLTNLDQLLTEPPLDESSSYGGLAERTVSRSFVDTLTTWLANLP